MSGAFVSGVTTLANAVGGSVFFFLSSNDRADGIRGRAIVRERKTCSSKVDVRRERRRCFGGKLPGVCGEHRHKVCILRTLIAAPESESSTALLSNAQITPIRDTGKTVSRPRRTHLYSMAYGKTGSPTPNFDINVITLL